MELEERNLRAEEYLRKKRVQKIERFADCMVVTFGIAFLALLMGVYGALYCICKGII